MRPVHCAYLGLIFLNLFIEKSIGESGNSTEGDASDPNYVITKAAWSYTGNTGPAAWKDLTGYSECGNNAQSPVNIVTADVQVDSTLDDLVLTNYDDSSTKTWTLSNNGHAVKVDVDDGGYRLNSSKFSHAYKLVQFHWHWGNVSTQGSEHTIDGTEYPLELHFVHYSTAYNTINDAISQSKGLAALGVMFTIQSSDNQAMKPIFDLLSNVNASGSSHTFNYTGSLMSFLPSDKSYYRYMGSLTTPACQESVVWTLLQTPVGISEAQMNQLRTNPMFENNVDYMVNNYRPPQPLNGRTISKPGTAGSSAGQVVHSVAAFVFTMVAAALWFL
ncbi:carbonic anhydrase isoform X2 [Lingula anatina]|uniref:Carbonic anhydrase n=1 Tax=Lingula anatina TaxID=7574 RepID=A0A1S3H128_LINAN|nr:carbonic anhydrase isoform X2 [Lingula anatina]|eukprot:XP_013379637.1 carbonic anhydrase isoform X2 [Lingula anatina]